jgi:PucR-like helix-turn-helix protein/diguanylate cyclase with GGDEF domain
LCCDDNVGVDSAGSQSVLNEDLATRRAALDQIVEDLRTRRAELVDRGVARIFSEIPAYSKIAHTSFVADVRDHVDVHHDAVIRSLAARRPLEGEELAFMRARAARRVGRVPLGDFMQGFRVYMEVLWEALLESAVDEHAREAALEAAGIFIRYLNSAATEAADVYVEAERLLLAQGDRVRRDLLEDLLAGRSPAPGPKLMAARDAGLLPAVPCVVIVAVPLSPPEDEHALRAVAVALARAVGSALQPLTVTRHDELVLIARVEGDVGGLVEALGQAQERLAATTKLAVGMSAVQSGLDRVSHAYAEAQAAVEKMRPAGGVLALPVMSAFDCLTLFGRETARQRIPAAVRQFVADDLADGRVLTTTLLEYVAADFNARLTAERLFLHPNTARYRLGKIEERTGCNLRHVSDVMDLLIAVRVAEAELADA